MRPDSWNLPLLLHVAGAAVLFGAVAAAAVSTLAADRVPEPEFMRRLAFRSLLIVGLPAYIVMRIGAEWLYSKGFDELEDDPAWLGIGYIVADVGLLVFLDRARARRSRGVEAEQRGRQGSGRPQHRAPRRDDRRRLGDGREARLSLSSVSGFSQTPALRDARAANVSAPKSTSRASSTAVSASRIPANACRSASSSGQPYAPAETSGKATDVAPELVRDRERARVARSQRRALVVRRASYTGPTVWITQRAGSSPAVVATASPAGSPSG